MFARRFGSWLACACYFLVALGLSWHWPAWAGFLLVIAAWYSTLHFRRFGPVFPWAVSVQDNRCEFGQFRAT